MKNYILAFFMLFNLILLKAQITEGEINYTSITTDTVNNTTTYMPDTVLFTYSFKNGSFSMFFGTDSVNNSMVVNSTGTYILSKAGTIKEYSFIPTGFNLDTLLNHTDSSTVRYSITTEHQAIKGYYCTKAYMFSLSEETGDTTKTTTIWYTDQIKGYNFIAGASETNLNLNGLILQYEYPEPNGTTIVTPKAISNSIVNDAIFTPDLTGYINRDNNTN